MWHRLSKSPCLPSGTGLPLYTRKSNVRASQYPRTLLPLVYDSHYLLRTLGLPLRHPQLKQALQQHLSQSPDCLPHTSVAVAMESAASSSPGLRSNMATGHSLGRTAFHIPYFRRAFLTTTFVLTMLIQRPRGSMILCTTRHFPAIFLETLMGPSIQQLRHWNN